MSICDNCLCVVCTAVKCPYAPRYKRDMLLANLNLCACQKRCFNQGRKLPCLQCDFFIHKYRTKIYRILRKERNYYTAKEVAEMLQKIIDMMGDKEK